LQRQIVLNNMPRAARTALNAVHVDVIVGKLRAVRNEIVRKIDSQLCRLGMYEKVCLNSLFMGLACWQRHKVIKDLQLGLPSGAIEHWYWMPGGDRKCLVAHVV
jgi:hypothetical protein